MQSRAHFSSSLGFSGLAIAALLLASGCGAIGTFEGMIGEEPASAGEGTTPTDEGGTLSPFLVNGQADHGHPSVGRLSSGVGQCTATLVGPRIVLTAGHCVDGGSTTFRVNNHTYYSQQVVRHPNYGGGNSNDVALVILTQTVSGVTPSPVSTQTPHVGQAIVLVGFGKESTNGTYGTKRMGTNTIASVASTTFHFVAGPNADTTVCNGDSGGPTFALLGGQEVVVGVHSTKDGSACGNGGTDMRVDAYENWLVPQSGGTIVLAGNTQPNPPTPNPPPAPTPPPPTPPAPATPGNVGEGQSCANQGCQSGLVCVTVLTPYQSQLGRFCMERCQTPGSDPACDGGEVCIGVTATDRVCYLAGASSTGYTHPGGNTPAPPAPTPPKPSNPPPAPSNPPPSTSCGSSLETSALNLLNQARAQNGRGAVACSSGALQVARSHGQDMCARHYFSHTSPEGAGLADRLHQANVSFKSAAENIGKGFSTAQGVINSWMGSASHRQVMLDASWTKAGIAAVSCTGGTIWTQVLLR